MTTVHRGVILIVLSLVVALAGPAQAQRPRQERPARPASVAAAAAPQEVSLRPALKKVLARVNRVREAHHRKPLRLTVCLTQKVAQPWARHMADTQTMVHRDMNTIFRLCPGLHAVGENIAYGYPTAAAVMKAWMHSQGHRENILRRGFTKIGLGLAYADDGTPYWVQNFGA